MAKDREQPGLVAPGSTVLGVAEAVDGKSWLLTPMGLMKRGEDSWQEQARGQLPLPASALATAGDTIFVGTSAGQIVYSRDGGETWYSGHLRHPVDGITALAASPNVERDGVLLAGTGSSGILRSTDGGRNWEPASFGLLDFSILALATAPEWGRREVVYAGTTHGLYRSPNGGRAWKQVDAGEGAFQALAVAGGLVLAGTEAKGLFRSTDGGQRWQAVPMTGQVQAINALWIRPGPVELPVCLAGTGDGQILRSADGGEDWSLVAQAPAPILCLDQAGKRLYAGLVDEGLLASEDSGLTWSPDHGLPLAPAGLQP